MGTRESENNIEYGNLSHLSLDFEILNDMRTHTLSYIATSFTSTYSREMMWIQKYLKFEMI